MFEFINNNWTEILSIIGASAWLPILIKPIINHFRVLRATMLHIRVFTNASVKAAISNEKKTGTILVFAVNMFIRKITIFATKIVVTVKLKNGNIVNTELFDISTLTTHNEDGSDNKYDVPMQNEFNISRSLLPDRDNLKFVGVLAENTSILSADEIEKIEMNIYYSDKIKRFYSKKVVIKYEDFPTFNATNLIDKLERTGK